MKFELKTENENYSKSFFQIFRAVFFLSLIIIFSDVAIKLGIISRHYQIEYNCRLLSFEKSTTNFKKLSMLSSLKSKQRIWEFCREVIKSYLARCWWIEFQCKQPELSSSYKKY